MQRTINHTGRRKLDQKQVSFRLIEEPNYTPSFDVTFNLDQSKIPGDAVVYVEAYTGQLLKRFQCGTVSALSVPDERSLSGLDRSKQVLFSVRIVDETHDLGRVIACAERLRPADEDDNDNRTSLITLRSRPLGPETWRVDVDPERKPELIINSRIPDGIGQIKHNPVFQSLILPGVLRQVLMFFLWNENDTDAGDVAGEWFRFAEHLWTERPSSNDPGELMNWIDEVVNRFSGRFDLCQLLLGKLEQEQTT